MKNASEIHQEADLAADSIESARTVLQSAIERRSSHKSAALAKAGQACDLLRESSPGGNAEAHRDLLEQAEFLVAKLHSELGHGAESLVIAQRRLDAAWDDATKARAHHLIAMAEATRGNAAVAKEHHERAVAYRRTAAADPEMDADCHFGLAGCLLQTGDIPTGLDVATKALVEAERGASIGACARLSFLLGQAHSILAQNSDAIRAFDRAQRDARQAGDRWLEARIEGQSGRVLFNAADYTGALRRYERALAMTRANDDTVMTNALLIHLSDTHIILGAADEALYFADELIDACRDSGNLYYEGHAYCSKAHIELEEGRVESSVRCATRALEIAERAGNESERARAQLALGSALHASGERARAHDLYEQVRSWSRATGVAWTDIHSSLAIADGRLEEGDYPAAIEAAREVLEESRFDKSIGRAHGVLARAHEQLGELAEALHHQREQHEIQLRMERENAQSRLEIARVQHELDHARRGAERAIARTEADYRTLVEVSPCAILQIESSGELIAANPAGRRMLDPARAGSIEGARLLDLVEVGDERDRVAAALSKASAGEPVDVLFRGSNGQHYQGGLVPICDRAGRVQRVLALGLDITERVQAEEEQRRLEEQRSHSSRLEAVGRLAGGVAHDFNNYLTSLMFRPTLIRNELEVVSAAIESQLREMENTIEGAARITRQLLALSRRQVTHARVMNPSTVVAGLESMLRLSLPENVDFTLALDSDCPDVFMDPGQVEQVALNLVLNARDAMPDGGTLTLSVEPVAADRVPASPDWSPGPGVRLRVGDTGEGIAPDRQQHIFEPFFTTKPEDRGTGLGLAMVHSITAKAGGFIDLESELGVGTVISIYLPVAAAEVQVESGEPEVGEPTTRPRGGVILVCDDSAQLRNACRQMLEIHGYQLLVAGDPSRAIELARSAPTVDLLITDIVLPEMDGFGLAAEVQEIHPGCETLYMSGYLADARLHARVTRRSVVFLEKPFAPDQLLARVLDLLSAESK